MAKELTIYKTFVSYIIFTQFDRWSKKWWTLAYNNNILASVVFHHLVSAVPQHLMRTNGLIIKVDSK